MFRAVFLPQEYGSARLSSLAWKRACNGQSRHVSLVEQTDLDAQDHAGIKDLRQCSPRPQNVDPISPVWETFGRRLYLLFWLAPELKVAQDQLEIGLLPATCWRGPERGFKGGT